jgi:hypothetical protein
MPLYRATIGKLELASGERWSNVYTLQDFDASSALVDAEAIADMEKAVSYSTIRIVSVKVVNLTNHLDRLAGSYSQAGALPTTGAQRNNIADGQWSPEYYDYVEANYSEPLFGTLPYVGPSGERPVSYETFHPVQNRQLGWHRRSRPGFRRGWVPV